MTDLTRAQITARIKKAVTDKGGPDSFARSLDVTPEYIKHCIAGKKPGPKVLKKIGVIETDGRYRQLERKQ